MITDVSKYDVQPIKDAATYEAYQKFESEMKAEMERQEKIREREKQLKKLGLSEPEFAYLQEKGVSLEEYQNLINKGVSKQAIFLLAEKGKENVRLSPRTVEILNDIVAGKRVEFRARSAISKEGSSRTTYKNYEDQFALAELKGIFDELPVSVAYTKNSKVPYISQGSVQVIKFDMGRISGHNITKTLSADSSATRRIAISELSPAQQEEVKKEYPNAGQYITGSQYSRMVSEKQIGELLSGESAKYPEARYSAYSQEFMDYVQKVKQKGDFTVDISNGEFVFTETPASIESRKAKAIVNIEVEPGKEPVAILGSGARVEFSKLSQENKQIVQSAYPNLQQQANEQAAKFFGVSGIYYYFKDNKLTETGLGASIQATPEKYGLSPTTVFTEFGGMTLTPEAYIKTKFPAIAPVIAAMKVERPLEAGESRFGAGVPVNTSDIYAEQTGESGILKDLAKTEGYQFQQAEAAAKRGDILSQFLYTGGGLTLAAARTLGGIRPLVQKAITEPEKGFILGQQYKPISEAQHKEVLRETVGIAALAVVGGASPAGAIPIFATLPAYEKREVSAETIAAGALNVGALAMFDAGKYSPIGKVEMKLGTSVAKGKLADVRGVISGKEVVIPVRFDFLIEKTSPTKYTGLAIMGRDVLGIIEEGGSKRVSFGRPTFPETTPIKYPFDVAYSKTGLKSNVADRFTPDEARLQQILYEDYFKKIGRPDLRERYLLTKEATKFAYEKELPFEKGLEIIKEGKLFKDLPPKAQEALLQYIRYSQPEVRTTFYGSSTAAQRGALERPFGDIDIYLENANAIAYAQGLADAITKAGGKAKVVERTVNIESGGVWEKAIDIHDARSPIPEDTQEVGSSMKNVGSSLEYIGFGFAKKPDVRITGEPSNIFAESSGTQAARLGSSISFLREAQGEVFLGPSGLKIKRTLDFINLVEKTGEVAGNKRFAEFEKEFTPYLTKYEKAFIEELRGKTKTTLSFKPEKQSQMKIEHPKVGISKGSVSLTESISPARNLSISPKSPSPGRSLSIKVSLSVKPSPSASPSIKPPQSVSISPKSPSPARSQSISPARNLSISPSVSQKTSASFKPSPSFKLSPSFRPSPSWKPSVSSSIKPSHSISGPPSKPPSTPPSGPSTGRTPPSFPPPRMRSQLLMRKGISSRSWIRTKSSKAAQGPIFASLAAVSRSQALYGKATQPDIKTANRIWKGQVRGEKELGTMEQMKRFKKIRRKRIL